MLPDHEELCRIYAYPDPVPVDGWVRGCMITSLDGSSTGSDGLSGSLGTPPDRRMMRLLRGLADVVMVGAGTVRAEGYGLPDLYPEHAASRVLLGQPPVASLAVVTAKGDLPQRMLDDPRLKQRQSARQEDHPLVILTTQRASAAWVRDLRNRLGHQGVVCCGESVVDPLLAVAALCELDLQRIVCEGGPTWLSQLAAARCLDELALTIAPRFTGGKGQRIAHGPVIDADMELVEVIPDSHTLITRWLVSRESPEAAERTRRNSDTTQAERVSLQMVEEEPGDLPLPPV